VELRDILPAACAPAIAATSTSSSVVWVGLTRPGSRGTPMLGDAAGAGAGVGPEWLVVRLLWRSCPWCAIPSTARARAIGREPSTLGQSVESLPMALRVSRAHSQSGARTTFYLKQEKDGSI